MYTYKLAVKKYYAIIINVKNMLCSILLLGPHPPHTVVEDTKPKTNSTRFLVIKRTVFSNINDVCINNSDIVVPMDISVIDLLF